MTDTAVLRAGGLRKEFGRAAGLVRAVDGVDLEVAPGETVAVMGPSGCGKSTLLHLLGGLERPARPPRRCARLIALSARLPVPLLLGLRLVARRPPRAVLHALSTAVTVTGLVTILTSAAVIGRATAGVHSPRVDRLNQATTTIIVMLLVLAAVNTVFMTWATVTDARHTSALARTFGATPRQISAGLSAAQVLPALLGAVVGLPAGVLLYRAATQEQALSGPPWWQLLAVPLGTVLTVVALTAVPARFGARRPVAGILRAEAG